MGKRVSFSEEDETKTVAEIDRQIEESKNNEEARQFNKFRLLKLVDGFDDENTNEESVDEAIHTDGDDSGESDATNKSKSSQSGKCRSNGTPSKKSRKRKKTKRKNTKVAEEKEKEFDIDLVSAGSPNGSVSDSLQVHKERNEHLELLNLDVRDLLPEKELRKMFGKNVVRDDRSKNQGYGGQRSKFVNHRHHIDIRHATGGPKMELDDFLNEVHKINDQDQQSKQSSSAKTNKSKSSSPNSKKADPVDLMMRLGRPIYFRFVHDKEYQAAHKEFVQAVHSAHPEAIVHNLSIYPQHAESLLQLSSIIRLSEDYKQASEMIEQALLVLERGFHSQFRLSTTQCRMSYRRPENRTFFIVLFEQIVSCHRRGLRITPFEYSKLLLSLDPENDPLMATQFLDFFAIRSKKYNFVIEFYNRWWQVQKLPNMNFSLALAYFHQSISPNISPADGVKFLALANEQLQKSLLLFPNFILPLLEACSGEPSSELKKCSYFDYSLYGNKYKTIPETLEVLIELYVKRSFGLWKQEQTLVWLEKNVAKMVGKFSSGELKEDKKKLADHWAQFKKPAPKNLLRHIALSNLKIKMPASASMSSFLSIDPFPPTDPIETYHCNLHQTQRPIQSDSAGSLSSLFFRSILPSFSMSEQAQTTGRYDTATTSGNVLGGSTSGRINSDEEVALGAFVMNELEQQPGGEGQVDFNSLHESVRNLTSTLTNLIRLTPNIGEQRENLANAARGSRNEQNQNEDREEQQD